MVVGGWWLGGRRGGRWLWLEFEEGREGDGFEVLREREREREKLPLGLIGEQRDINT